MEDLVRALPGLGNGTDVVRSGSAAVPAASGGLTEHDRLVLVMRLRKPTPANRSLSQLRRLHSMEALQAHLLDSA